MSDVPALAPQARLLLLCARLSMDQKGREAIASLPIEAQDWPNLLTAADAHYIVPMLSRHLLGSASVTLPAAAREQLRDLQRRCAMQALQLVRAQQQLVEDVFRPRGIEHAFFKGAALAQHYYGDPAQRQYRDIDVLVEAGRLAEAGEALLALGYEITNPTWGPFRQRQLAAFCRYHSALELRSPQGVLVELHRTIDSTGCIFSSRQLLAAAISPPLGRYRWRMLAASDLFVYLCYHHSRHRWSSLHWCADLDAVTGHPDFDLAEVRRRASALALEATVEEALQLHRDLRSLALGDVIGVERPPSRFLPDCLAAVVAALSSPGDPLPQGSLPDMVPLESGSEREPDFLYSWQFSPRYRRRFRLFRWRPSANDVNAWPLPLSLHWLYYLLRPARIGLRRLMAAIRGGDPRLLRD